MSLEWFKDFCRESNGTLIQDQYEARCSILLQLPAGAKLSDHASSVISEFTEHLSRHALTPSSLVLTLDLQAVRLDDSIALIRLVYNPRRNTIGMLVESFTREYRTRLTEDNLGVLKDSPAILREDAESPAGRIRGDGLLLVDLKPTRSQLRMRGQGISVLIVKPGTPGLSEIVKQMEEHAEKLSLKALREQSKIAV